MTTSLKNKKAIQKAFQDLLEPASREEKLELETLMLSTKFLSEIQLICDKRNILKKELAEKIGTSPSYVTQLFRGNKIINLETIAKIQIELGVSFNIRLAEAESGELKTPEDIQRILSMETPEGMWYFKPHIKPNEEKIKGHQGEQIAA